MKHSAGAASIQVSSSTSPGYTHSITGIILQRVRFGVVELLYKYANVLSPCLADFLTSFSFVSFIADPPVRLMLIIFLLVSVCLCFSSSLECSIRSPLVSAGVPIDSYINTISFISPFV